VNTVNIVTTASVYPLSLTFYHLNAFCLLSITQNSSSLASLYSSSLAIHRLPLCLFPSLTIHRLKLLFTLCHLTVHHHPHWSTPHHSQFIVTRFGRLLITHNSSSHASVYQSLTIHRHTLRSTPHISSHALVCFSSFTVYRRTLHSTTCYSQSIVTRFGLLLITHRLSSHASLY
jgi:hypothetical protein